MMNGLRILPGYLDLTAQQALVKEIRRIATVAPLYRPRMQGSGRPFSVQMTNAGPLGWVSDESGYRYQPHHPVTGQPWPPIPEPLLALWRSLTRYPAEPECCLVNYYGQGARMGLHQDRDEEARDAPVLSVSLGDSAVFRVGGPERGGKTTSVKLDSGTVLVLGGAARMAFHGIDRILFGSSRLLPKGGRINLTLRRVTHPFLAD
ncbi:alpha-ketoglutarate-dependent dioxygenase AlkB [Telmatospirillum sp. J64-1]|uniref:alpha-ketoglutarate-dependent dioxygenase AlkB family protein n=1 Tax=Telmatospirillum sp. J64-1 TaxID=2502183 RepID=UPI00115D0799|nr:alpha-ketoglutarate-dependent dioxygenase AlkB [Telmatospirillum sp. J64-1]